MPFAPGKSAQGLLAQAQDRRNAQQGGLIKITLAQLADCLRIDARFFREFGIRNAQTALRFSNDITHVVFERNHFYSLNVDRFRFQSRA